MVSDEKPMLSLLDELFSCRTQQELLRRFQKHIDSVAFHAYVSLWMVDPTSSELLLVYESGMRQKGIGATHHRVAIGSGWIGRAMEAAQASSDGFHDDHLHEGRPEWSSALATQFVKEEKFTSVHLHAWQTEGTPDGALLIGTRSQEVREYPHDGLFATPARIVLSLVRQLALQRASVAFADLAQLISDPTTPLDEIRIGMLEMLRRELGAGSAILVFNRRDESVAQVVKQGDPPGAVRRVHAEDRLLNGIRRNASNLTMRWSRANARSDDEWTGFPRRQWARLLGNLAVDVSDHVVLRTTGFSVDGEDPISCVFIATRPFTGLEFLPSDISTFDAFVDMCGHLLQLLEQARGTTAVLTILREMSGTDPSAHTYGELLDLTAGLFELRWLGLFLGPSAEEVVLAATAPSEAAAASQLQANVNLQHFAEPYEVVPAATVLDLEDQQSTEGISVVVAPIAGQEGTEGLVVALPTEGAAGISEQLALGVASLAEQVALSESLREQRETLTQVDRLGRIETASLFALEASHEIKNMLSPLSNGMARLGPIQRRLQIAARRRNPRDQISDELAKIADVKENAEDALRQASRLAEWTAKLVPSETGSEGDELMSDKAETFDLVSESEMYVRILRKFARKQGVKLRISERTNIDEESPEALILASHARFAQIAINIIRNAVDASAESSNDVEVWVDREEKAGQRYVALRVRDNGEGMDDATKALAFRRFGTTKPDGYGIGLSSALRCARADRATIEIEWTSPRDGTQFAVFYPEHVSD